MLEGRVTVTLLVVQERVSALFLWFGFLVGRISQVCQGFPGLSQWHGAHQKCVGMMLTAQTVRAHKWK